MNQYKQQISRIPLAVVLMLLSFSANAATVDQFRVHHSPERTRAVFELSGPVDYQMFTLENPSRLVLDIKSTVMKADANTINLVESPVSRIRTGIRQGSDLRVVFELTKEVRPNSFTLKPIEQYSDRLVVDLYVVQTVEDMTPVKQEDLVSKQMRDIIVAIDAGHGGDDPGAIGHGGLMEKKVVFSIASRLNDLFTTARGYKGLMIRKGDYYVELRRRTRIARENHADIFLSIHADAFRSPRANGASVYALSHRGATSETAKILAEKENRTDLIGGVGGVSLNDKDDLLVHVLLDLATTASLSASLSMGEKVLRELGQINKLHKRRVEQAGFVVLKSPEIPSLLIESGYISNPEESRKLATSHHQQRIARAIFKGVNQYLEETPPPGTWLAWKMRSSGGKSTTYVVERGDTLSEIAIKHHISFENLKRVNGMSSDRIRIGQIIQIPAS